VIIGNDGISSSITTEYLALYYMMHHQDQSPNPFQLSNLLKMIHDTYTYANSMLETKLGEFKQGYQADLLMIPYIPPTEASEENAFGHLFFGMFNAFQPKHVWIKGDIKIKNYQIKTSLENKIKQAQQASKRLWDILSKDV
jgi:cytosine/adenosine deaminase-related metal-dependent hydrolase